MPLLTYYQVFPGATIEPLQQMRIGSILRGSVDGDECTGWIAVAVAAVAENGVPKKRFPDATLRSHGPPHGIVGRRDQKAIRAENAARSTLSRRSRSVLQGLRREISRSG